MQWNPVNTATNGPEKFGRINGGKVKVHDLRNDKECITVPIPGQLFTFEVFSGILGDVLFTFLSYLTV